MLWVCIQIMYVYVFVSIGYMEMALLESQKVVQVTQLAVLINTHAGFFPCIESNLQKRFSHSLDSMAITI